MEFSVYEGLADLLKVVAHPVRLCILGGLVLKGSSDVKTMQESLKVSQSCVSQHLAKLRAEKIITAKRNNNRMIYSITNEKVKSLIIEILRVR